MDIKYYIHGAPYGFRYLGEKEEYDFFFKKYYNNRNEIDEFRVDAINRANKQYFYYTYILGKNVIDGQNNRPGSYLGLTIRLDTYYKKVTNLYYLLDSFFYSYLYGVIIDGNDSKRVFKTQEFENLKSKIDDSFSQLEKLIEQTFSARDLVTLKFKQSDQIVKLNVADANEETVASAISSNGHVSISLSHLNKQSSKIKAEADDAIKDINEKSIKAVDAEKAKWVELKKQYDDRGSELEDLKKTLQDKDVELSKHKNKSEKFDTLIAEIGPLVNAISNGKKKSNGKIVVETQSGNSGITANDLQEGLYGFFAQRDKKRKGKWFQLFALVASILTLAMVIWYGISLSSQSEKISGNTEQIKVSLDSLSPKSQTLIEEEEIPTSNPLLEVDEQSISDCRINIEEFKSANDHAIVGKTYHISVRSNPYSTSGTWKSTPKLKMGNDDHGDFFEAEDPGMYKIEYVIGNTVIASREIEVKDK